MKIALCHEAVLPRRGGCETYVANLARRLVRDGHDVRLYARYVEASELPAAVTHHAVRLPPHPRFLRPWFFSRACARMLGAADHDVSVGFDKVVGVDVLYPQAGVYAASVDYNLYKHPSPFVRRILKLAKWFDPAHLSFLGLERRGCRDPRTTLVAISHMVRRHLIESYPHTAGRVEVLHVATPPERFDEADRPRRRAKARAEWGLPVDAVAGLFVGMNYRLKGIVPLLHALARVPAPMHLLVAGKSDYREYARLAGRLGVAGRVRFLGYRKDVRDAYFAADLLVHPTFYDPCSNVVMEALACGLGAITTRHNGAHELMTGGGEERAEGYVVADPHDVSRLAWAMLQMLDPARRAACSAAARRTAGGWTFERHYQKLLAILGDAAQGRRAA